MKNKILILFLLISASIFAQGTLTPFDRIKIKQNQKMNSVTRVLVQDSINGNVGWVFKSSLLPPPPSQGLNDVTLIENFTEQDIEFQGGAGWIFNHGVNTGILDGGVGLTGNRIWAMPDGNGTLALSVNGIFSDEFGDIPLDLSGYQLVSNLQNSLTSSTTKYPTVSAVRAGLDGKEDVLPDQVGHAGEFLTTDGSNKSWSLIPTPTLDDILTVSGPPSFNYPKTITSNGVSGDGFFLRGDELRFSKTPSGQNYNSIKPTGITMHDYTTDQFAVFTPLAITTRISDGSTYQTQINYPIDLAVNGDKTFITSINGNGPDATGNATVDAGLPLRKSNILVLVGGQSNCGTDPATGRVPYADMPSYLTATPTNIQWVNIVSSVYTLQSWTPDPAQQWGWLNQTLFTLSQEYSNVIWSKRGLGGTTILPERLGNYPRANFKAQTLYAIAQADAAWGAGTYDVVMLWNQGETNGATLADAQVYEAALKEWFLEARSSTVNIPIIYNKMGRLQVQAFPYIISDIQPAQLNTSLYDFRNKLITGESNTAWELQDLLSDTSHYNKAGAITLGANFTDRIFETLERTKTNNSPPVLVSATIPAGGATIVLTYNKTLNPAVAPFWRDFVLNSTKKVVSTAISGSTCVLTVSEPFYGTGSQLLTYYRSSNFEGAIMDEFGNKAKSFTDVTVTNSSGITTPTYTNKYTSNFATVDGWTGDANCTPTGAETIGGVTNCLKVLLNGDITPLIYHTAVLTGTSGHSYRVKMSIYVPLAYWGNGSSVNSISFKSSGAQIHNVYTELRGALLADKWINLEYTWTQSNTDTQIRFEGQGVMGTAFYVKNIVVDKIN